MDFKERKNNVNKTYSLNSQACVMWTGSFPEMALLEVTLPGGFGADAKLLYAQLQKTTSRKLSQFHFYQVP